MAGFERYPAKMKKLGKVRTSKACLYLKSLDDVDPGGHRGTGRGVGRARAEAVSGEALHQDVSPVARSRNCISP